MISKSRPIFVQVLIFCLIGLSLISETTLGKVQVVTTIPDLAWAARKIGGPHVEVVSLLKGSEDPHYVDAVPEFIRLVANADVLCSIGLSLEIGWLPKILNRAGNAKVKKGGPGECVTSSHVQVLGKSTQSVDRSMGDVHPEGNPHFWISPEQFVAGAEVIQDALIRTDSSNAESFRQGFQSMKKEVLDQFQKNRKILQESLKSFSGPLLIEYHSEFAYWLKDFGLTSYGAIEEKPGILPSVGRLADLAKELRKAPSVRLILASTTNPKSTLEKFHELAGLPVVSVPTLTSERNFPQTYLEFQDHLLNKVLAVVKATSHAK